MRVMEYYDIVDFVESYIGEGRDELSSAFAICYAKFKQIGAFTYDKDGNLKLTSYGKKLHLKHSREREHKRKVAEYERILRDNRKGPRRRDDEPMPAFMKHCVVAVYNRLVGKKR